MLMTGHRTLQQTLAFIAEGKLKPITPITQFDAVDVKHAFRHLQGGDHIGKLILNMPDDHDTLMPVMDYHPMTFRHDVAYFLVGGVGGLGRSLAIWLIERGARHLVFLSRSAGVSQESLHLAVELESMGCSVTMVSGSVNEMGDIKKASSASPLPIKGVFQLAMVQRVGYLLRVACEPQS
jgi:hypothetical protein